MSVRNPAACPADGLSQQTTMLNELSNSTLSATPSAASNLTMQATTPSAAAGPAGRSGAVRFALVVDDEPPIRMVVSEKLRGCGFDVQDARDGEEGLDKALLRRPDVIITDLQMPHMSGIDLAQRIAKEPRTAGVPMILLTARGHILNQNLLDGTSIRRIVPKPFSARELMGIVEQVLAENGAAEAVRHVPSNITSRAA